jgi:predicted molibdopterin-dependent oxidoreductase YjgC
VERVSKAPYLVVQASFESKLTAQADVVLPVTVWSEQEGHYINLDGRVQKTEKVLSAPENVRDNLAVVNELATRMNISLESDWQQAILGRKSIVVLNQRTL